MGAQGTTTINLGAFPGASDGTAVITGQAGILSGSLVEAWILPAATADHSADEHWVENLIISAGNIVAGTGFTIYLRDGNQEYEPYAIRGLGSQPRVYGIWNIAWVWN